VNDVRAAERLLDLADSVKRPRDRVLLACGVDDLHLAHVRLALDLDRRSQTFKMRACAEGWCMLRIIEEMY